MAHVNIFEIKTDEKLLTLYDQFLEAEKNAGFSDDNELGKIKREYENAFGANAVLMLQIELTHTIADRWYKNNSNQKKYRYKVGLYADDCMEGYISLTPEQAKLFSFVTDFNNWDISHEGYYCGNFEIEENSPINIVSVKYRPHRGSLEDSMQEEKEFKSVEEMFDYISESSDGMIRVSDLSISDESVADDRINWKETRYVCIKRFGWDEYDTPQCIGMCCIENIDEI